MKKPYSVMLGMLLACALIASMGAINLTLVAPTLPALVDNNPAINNEAAIEAYWAADVKLPAGLYYFSGTIDSPGEGAILSGSGCPENAAGDTAYRLDNGTKVTALVYNGTVTPTTKRIAVNDPSCTLEDFYLSGVPITNVGGNLTPTTAGDGIGISFDAPRSGEGYVKRVTIVWCKNAIVVQDNSIGDHTVFDQVTTQQTDYVYTCYENQAVETSFRDCTFRGGGNNLAVFNMVAGGRLHGTVTPLCDGVGDTWGAFILLPTNAGGFSTGTQHSGHFDLFIWLDNTTYFDASIVERVTNSGFACVVDITGYGAQDVTFPDPIPLNVSSEFTINIKRNAPGGADFTYP